MTVNEMKKLLLRKEVNNSKDFSIAPLNVRESQIYPENLNSRSKSRIGKSLKITIKIGSRRSKGRRGNPLRTRIGLTRTIDTSVSAPKINKLHSTSKSPLQQRDIINMKRSKYSPSLKHFDQSRSLSAISHINSNINEELREKVDITGLVDQLIGEIEPKLQQKHVKLMNYIDDYVKFMKSFGVKKNAEEQMRVMEERELKKIEKEEFSFLERKNLSDVYIKKLQEKMEDREIIYRAIYKQMSKPRNLERFLEMKAKEMERNNDKVKNECKREIKELRLKEKDLDRKKRYLEDNLAEEEAKWLHMKHQMVLRYEGEGREKMSEKAHDVLLKFLRSNVMEAGFVEKEKEFVKWIKRWEKRRERMKQAEIFSSRVRLKEEIYKMEKKLQRANKRQSSYYLRKSNMSGRKSNMSGRKSQVNEGNRKSKILNISGNLGFVDSGRTNSIHVNNGGGVRGSKSPVIVNRSSQNLEGRSRASRHSKNRSFVNSSKGRESNYFKFR